MASVRFHDLIPLTTIERIPHHQLHRMASKIVQFLRGVTFEIAEEWL